MSYTYLYPRPALTVDAVVFTFMNDRLKVLLIKRADEPFKGRWAFPGGFVDENEKVEDAVKRELYEETGMKDIELKQFYTASESGRDPRGWTVSVIFYGFVFSEKANVKAGSDAKDAQWHSISNLPPLAFDHQKIMNRALTILDNKAKNLVFGPQLLPKMFTHHQILSLYEQITNSKEDSEKLFNKLVKKNVIDISGEHLKFTRKNYSD